MQIRYFAGVDFEPASKLLGTTRHASHGERSYWHGSDELCGMLARSDQGFVAEEDGTMLGVILLASPREEDRNRDLRMHWMQQRTIILAVCRSLGINPREDDDAPMAQDVAGTRLAQRLGDYASTVVLLQTAQTDQHDAVARALLDRGVAWLADHGVDLLEDAPDAQEDGSSLRILPSGPADDEAVGTLLNSHASQHGVTFVNYNYHIELDGKLVAGVVAWSLGSDVHIDMLAVDEAYRRQGLGAALLSHVEEQARRDGRTTASLDTFSFQAPDYYPAHGYHEVYRSKLDDGSERIYFSKRL